jgi:hypothetical protein
MMEFRNLAGVLTNPSTVTVQHENPAGAKDSLTPVNDSDGVYHADYTFVAADAEGTGRNEFEVVATGAVVDADKFRVQVLPL